MDNVDAVSCMCPICGGPLKFSAGAQRMRGFCECQKGPVLEIDSQSVAQVQPLDKMMLEEVDGIGRQIAKMLYDYGIRTLSDVDALSDDEILILPSIGAATLEKLRAAVDNARA